MNVEIVMPQMGESITEGTITKWLKKIGDTVEKDEPLLEISTDKVDAEVPSASAGVLLAINHHEGETVEVGKVVAIIGDENGANVPSLAIESPKSEAVAPTVEIPKFEASKPDIETPQTETAPISGDAVEIVMPQMGESITEGTITKWLKKIGDKVEKDEPLFEISTDKVDAEVPSVSAGVLLAINHHEGETVEVGKVVALVGSSAQVQSPKSEVQSQPEVKVETPKTAIETPKVETPIEIPKVAVASERNGKDATVEDLRRTKSSPLVRNIAKQNNVDLAKVPGTGMSGRVTKKDILSFIESGAALKPADLLVKSAPKPEDLLVKPAPKPEDLLVKPAPQIVSQVSAAAGDRIEPMSAMRKKIAEHMVSSKRTSAHVTSVYEIDMTGVVKFRDKNKKDFQARYGTKLTYMPFIFQAVAQSLRQFPIVNSQVQGDNIVYKGDINLGMAVALDWGLIVPVIKQADRLSLSGLALAANDLADRARAKKLLPDEVTGGTFTITNPGVFGGLIGTPIINQPQVAILYVGAIEKRAKVITTDDGEDFIAIRSMAYFALTYDHRVVDGADAEKFLSFLKKTLETSTFSV